MNEYKANNKLVLITGAAKRIGKALSFAFHQAGYDILMQYGESRKEAEALCQQLNQQRADSAWCLHCQLDNKASLETFIDACQPYIDTLQLLINNASRFYPTPLAAASSDDWDRLMNSNLRAPFLLSQAFATSLRNNHGNIINIVDIYAERPLPEHSIYCASKAGLVMLSKSLAQELAPEIRVNAIAPGAILWPENGQDNQQGILDKIALKKQGSEQDIVGAALYLNGASYVTGQVIQVDGGRSLTI